MIRSVVVRDVFGVFCYFCIDGESRRGFVVDPGAEASRLLALIERNGWTIERILLTHGHFDHTGAVCELSQRLGIPYSIHRNGQQYLLDTQLNLSAYCQRNVVLRDAEFFDDGALFVAGQMRLQAIHTPGHTPDSVVYLCPAEQAALVGDTIFRGSPGTTEYEGGDPVALRESLSKILSLPAATRLFPGHSSPTTVATERPLYGAQLTPKR